jgi:hypothetical protein
MRPMPGVVLVRPISTDETTPGGRIILPDTTRDQWTRCQAEVVASGGGARCEDEDCERIHLLPDGDKPGDCFHFTTLAPGDWVLVPPRSFLPTPDPKVFAVGVDDCWAILSTE